MFGEGSHPHHVCLRAWCIVGAQLVLNGGVSKMLTDGEADGA